MGITIREVVEDIGGGAPRRLAFKAVSSAARPEAASRQPRRHPDRLRVARPHRRDHGLRRADRPRPPRLHRQVARYFLEFCSASRAASARSAASAPPDARHPRPPDHRQGENPPTSTSCAASPTWSAGPPSAASAAPPQPRPLVAALLPREFEAHVAGRCPPPSAPTSSTTRHRRRIGCTLCAQHCPAVAIPLTPFGNMSSSTTAAPAATPAAKCAPKMPSA
jgi:hypothetical protein